MCSANWLNAKKIKKKAGMTVGWIQIIILIVVNISIVYWK